LFRQKCSKPFPPVRGPKGVPPPPPRIRWRENSLRSNSSRRKVDSGLRLRRTQCGKPHGKQHVPFSFPSPQLFLREPLVTTTFCISPCTPISYTSFLRPTAVSRLNVELFCIQILTFLIPTPHLYLRLTDCQNFPYFFGHGFIKAFH